MNRRILAPITAAACAAAAVAALVVPHGAGADRRPWGIGNGLSASRAVPAPATSSKPSSVPSSVTPSSDTTTSPAPGGTGTTPAVPALGTLVTNGDRAAAESRAGVKVAMIEFKWKYLEPTQGVYNEKYGTSMAAQVRKMQAAGMRVTLGLGLHYTPQWALDVAGSRMVDQQGRSSSQVDLVFNSRLRALAAEYIRMIDRAVGLESFWAVRITSGGVAELMYPSTAFWAFSNGAQNGADKPASMAPNPMPGWKPSQPATPAQRDAWARWYVGALDDVADWQMDLADQLGFTGYYQILTPGQGVRPKQWRDLMAAPLKDGVLGRGAAWQLVYANLQHRDRITAYVTSVGEKLLNTDTCQPSDTTVAVTSDTVFKWSTSRWITRLAHEYGFTVAGEVPGLSGSTASYYRDLGPAGLLASATRQSVTCGFQALYWAHDDQLWNGTLAFPSFAAHAGTDPAMPALAR